MKRTENAMRPIQARLRAPAGLFERWGEFSLLFGLTLSICMPGAAQKSPVALVKQTLRNEAAERAESEQAFYVSQERSTRTGGHLWTQRVVHLKSGKLRRLVAIDGVPLTPEQARSEDQRIAKLVADPDAFRKANHEHGDDKDMSGVIARAFTFTYAGKNGECTLLHFAPDPSFKPASYEERILQTLEGNVSIKEPEDRVCEIEATFSKTLEIGYGLLGKLQQGGRVHLISSRMSDETWQTTNLNIHIIGKILLVRDVSQNIDEKRTEFRHLPPDITLAQAAQLIK